MKTLCVDCRERPALVGQTICEWCKDLEDMAGRVYNERSG